VCWVLDQYTRIEAYEIQQSHLMTLRVELGTSRAIARALGADVPPLATVPQKPDIDWTPPDWMEQYAKANNLKQ